MSSGHGHGGGEVAVFGQENAENNPTSKNYRFNPDEMRAIKECNRESFWYRCVPIGGAFGGLTYFAVKNGYLSPSPKWGAAPKMISMIAFGYFIGKFSYHQKCMDKLMSLPNSPLAEQIRKARSKGGSGADLIYGGGFQQEPNIHAFTPATQDPNSFIQNEGRMFSDVSDTRPLDSFDTEGSRASSSNSDFGVSNPNDTTSQMLNDDNLPKRTPQMSTSYDDLRNKNREEYEKTHRKSPPPSSYGGESRQSPQRVSQPVRQEPEKPGVKNQYGDVWEKTE